MHKSRVCGLMIDCAEDRFAEAVGFWSGALGAAPKREPSEKYVPLALRLGCADVLLQQVSRDQVAFHLDIETDDVEAEVRRLEALGATRKRYVKGWWVMIAPTAHEFCVVPKQTDDFPAGAVEWPD